MRLLPAAAAVLLLAAGCAPPGTVVADGDSAPLPPHLASPPTPPPSSPPPPSPASTCDPSGVRIEAGAGDAAAGLRVVDFELINCGRTPYRVNGYPVVRALDEQRNVIDIQVLRGVTEITGNLPNVSGPPKPVVLQPGERATTVVAWRNTYDDIREPPVKVPYLEMTPAAGGPALIVAPESALDLGSTGRLGVSPWLSRP
ncbi:MAG: DUF4232 domain-containing protein [Actinoplanes sp.]